MIDNTSITLLHFAWSSLTEQQRFRIEVKYEIVQRLKNRGSEKKRNIYRAIADEYGYTMRRIEDIATHNLK